jgi:hypothetical protein
MVTKEMARPPAQRQRSVPVLRSRSAQHEGQEREHAGRQGRQNAGEEGEAQRRHRVQMALPSRAAIELAFVSPTERPTSFSPLKTMSVDCNCTPNFLTISF